MKKLTFALFAMVATTSLGVGCVAGSGVDEEGDVSAKDPLGVDLEAVGLSAGDRPCGDRDHVASVVDGEGRYLAFCAGGSRDTVVVQVTPAGIAPVGEDGGCALKTYLAATPDDAAVPQALVDACPRTSIGRRRASAEPVRVGSSDALPPVANSTSDCNDSAYFVSTRCDPIETYANHPQVKDSVFWCSSLGPYTTNVTRTASAQGLPTAFEGKMTVAACGSATTNVKGWAKASNGTWVNTAGDNINVSPNNVVTIMVAVYDVEDVNGWPDAIDLRFSVTPSAGGSYRYTGAFVEFYPVP